MTVWSPEWLKKWQPENDFVNQANKKVSTSSEVPKTETVVEPYTSEAKESTPTIVKETKKIEEVVETDKTV